MKEGKFIPLMFRNFVMEVHLAKGIEKKEKEERIRCNNTV